VDERDAGSVRHDVGDHVHGVGAEHDDLGAGGRQRARLAGQKRSGLLPAALALEPLHVGEVDRAQQAVPGVKAAQPVADEFVDEAVVRGRALPAHAAQQSEPTHALNHDGIDVVRSRN
jgi:hypothetical protein